jgi:hypothetical protein
MQTSDDLDPDLVELLHHVAHTVPGYRADLATVIRRRTARRQRQVLVAALASGVAAVILVAGAALVRPDFHPAPRPADESPSSAQRLFISPMGVWATGTNGQPVGVKVNDDLGEVLPGGTLVLHTVAGLSAVATAVALPDGGLAALGWPAASASAAGTPTASDTGADNGLTLAVLRPDGSLRLLRNGAGSGLVGASEQQVYVTDGHRHVSAVDLTTGKQQMLPLGTDIPVVIAGGRAIDLITDLPAPQATSCAIRVRDASSGARLSDKPLPVGDCDMYGASLSPDGRRLAIVQPGSHAIQSNQMVVVVVEVATGTQLAREVVDQTSSDQLFFGGLSWSDSGHVRVAWIHVPEPAVRMYDKAEVLRQATVPVPGR